MNVEFEIASCMNIGNLTDCYPLTASGSTTVKIMESKKNLQGDLSGCNNTFANPLANVSILPD